MPPSLWSISNSRIIELMLASMRQELLYETPPVEIVASRRIVQIRKLREKVLGASRKSCG
jgi:hypothetical protein